MFNVPFPISLPFLSWFTPSFVCHFPVASFPEGEGVWMVNFLRPFISENVFILPSHLIVICPVLEWCVCVFLRNLKPFSKTILIPNSLHMICFSLSRSLYRILVLKYHNGVSWWLVCFYWLCWALGDCFHLETHVLQLCDFFSNYFVDEFLPSFYLFFLFGALITWILDFLDWSSNFLSSFLFDFLCLYLFCYFIWDFLIFFFQTLYWNIHLCYLIFF